MHKIIRQELESLSNIKIAEKMRILYGGSVSPENVAPIGGVPLVKNRTAGLAIGVKIGNLALSTKAGGVLMS